METITNFGTYGQREVGVKGTQIMQSKMYGGAFLVNYVIENLADPLGTLEVLEVARFKDEFGTGRFSRVAVDDIHEFDVLEQEFTRFFRDAIKYG